MGRHRSERGRGRRAGRRVRIVSVDRRRACDELRVLRARQETSRHQGGCDRWPQSSPSS
jgi:hypothetical protein